MSCALIAVYTICVSIPSLSAQRSHSTLKKKFPHHFSFFFFLILSFKEKCICHGQFMESPISYREIVCHRVSTEKYMPSLPQKLFFIY